MSETIRELTVQISANGASTAQKDIKGLQNAVAQADAKFKAAGAGIKNFESTTAGMQAKVTMLKDKLSAQQMVVDKAAKAYDAAKTKLASASKNQQDYADKVEKARAALATEVAISGKDSAASKELAANLEKVEGQHAALAKSAQNAAQKVQTEEIALNKARAVLKGTEAELRAANATLKQHGSVWAQAAAKVAAAGDKMTSWGKKTSAIGKNLTMGVTVPVIAAGAAAYKAWDTMDNGLDTVIRKTGATGAALVPLEAAYNNVFLGVKTTAEDAGIAVGEVNTRFKATGTELEDLSKTFIQFADVNETDLNESIGKTSKILSQWQQPASAAGGFLGLLTSEAQRTGISVDQLMDSVQTNGATLKGMNLNLSQSVQMMANFEAAGINADTSLAALKKSAVLYTKEGQTLEAGFASTVKAIQAAKSETEALAIAQKVFGAKGALEMATAIREGRLSVTGLSADMSKMGDVVGKTFAEINGDTPILDKVKNKLVATGAQFGKAMLPWIEQAAGKLGELVDGFANLDPAIQQNIVGMAGIAAAIGPALTGIGKMATGAGALMKLFSGPAGWITVAVTALAGLGIAIGSIQSESDKLNKSLDGFSVNVDTASISGITEDINTGINAANTVHTVTVSVNADTQGIKDKLDGMFSDGKFTKGEYRAASKFVASMVAPDLVLAKGIVDQKVAEYRKSLDGAVDSLGQPLTQKAKDQLVTEFTEKNSKLITDLQTAQTDYESLIKEIYNQRMPATEAQMAALDALFARLAEIRAEIKLATDEAVQVTKANYELTVAGAGNKGTYGAAFGFVTGQQNAQEAAFASARDTLLKNSNGDVNAQTAAWDAYYSSVAAADVETQKAYMSILEGMAKSEGASDELDKFTQSYKGLVTAGQLNELDFSTNTKEWLPAFKRAFGEDGTLVNQLTENEKIQVSSLLSTATGEDTLDFGMLQSFAQTVAGRLNTEMQTLANDPEVNVVAAYFSKMLETGTFDSIDPNLIDGALESLFQMADLEVRGKDIGKSIVEGVPVGIGEGVEGMPSDQFDALRDTIVSNAKTAFQINSPSKVMEPIGYNITAGVAVGVLSGMPQAVGAVTSVYAAMIAEAVRMRPLLQNAMGFVSSGGGMPGGGKNGSPTYTANASQNIENYNVFGTNDTQIIMDNMRVLNKNTLIAFGRRPR